MAPRKKAAPANKAAAKKAAPATPAVAPPETDTVPVTPAHEKVAAKAKAAKAPAVGSPAWQRADRVRALEEERRGYEMRGLKDRVAQVDEQLKLAKREVSGRTAPPSDEA